VRFSILDVRELVVSEVESGLRFVSDIIVPMGIC